MNAGLVLRTLPQPAIKVPDCVAEAASIHMRSLIVRLRVVHSELRDAERKLDELCAAIGEADPASEQRIDRRDVTILKSLPGIGRINLVTLLAEASGTLIHRDYRMLRTLSDVAPVTKRSGESHSVVMRNAAHVRLRNAVYHWARVATQNDSKSRTRYAALRKRGRSHGRALRDVADRLLAVACVLLQRQTPFVAHPGVEAARDNGHVFRRWMMVGWDLVICGHSEADDVRARLGWIAGQDGKLRSLRKTCRQVLDT